jgi:broad specificity phosphatase PhoE
MFKYLILFSFVFASCKTTTYYVVRHAEKEVATTKSDVPLSAAGQQRAQALQNQLTGKVERIFSTNFIRTKTTAEPLARQNTLQVETYDPRDTGFVRMLKGLNHKGILVVGHSNTVDDLVNGLLGRKELSDLPETQYGDLFIIKKRKNNYSFTQSRFGQ